MTTCGGMRYNILCYDCLFKRTLHERACIKTVRQASGGQLKSSGYLLLAWQQNAEVDVEYRSSSGGSFGQGKKKSMCFSSFLERLKAGEEDLYLTTQTVRTMPSWIHSVTWRLPGEAAVPWGHLPPY